MNRLTAITAVARQHVHWADGVVRPIPFPAKTTISSEKVPVVPRKAQ